MKTFSKLFFVIFLLLSILGQNSFAERKQKILVLHSYHQGLEWSDNISRGIRAAFSPYSGIYEIHYEYLDTKRNTGKKYTDELIKFISAKHKSLQYSAIIVADNNALKMLNNHQIVFENNPPVIFCGINNYTTALTQGIDRVAGVVEEADHRSNIELIRQLHPGKTQLSIILDQTPTGNAVREELKPIEKEYEGILAFKHLRDFELDELPDMLSGLDETDPIYLLTFNRDSKNNFISYTEGIEMLNKYAKGPIYGAWDFYMGKGLVGGRITSGYLQGQEAAKLALKILNGSRLEERDLIKATPTQYMFDYRYMEKSGIKLSSLPSGSVVLNEPPSAYERYKAFLIFVTITSFFVALILLWKFKTQQALLEAEQEQGAKLEKSVYERTRELEIANKKLQRLSNVDGLTQLYNRRYFDESLLSEIRRLQRNVLPLSLMMCDIDYFKKFNDSYGHVAGDDCLKNVVESIRKFCNRISDIPARYGGEEFAIILPCTDAEGAMAMAEHIRQDIEEKNIPHKNSNIKDRVSISIGVVTVTPHIHTTPTEVIALADQALYESKNNGRDRVTLKSE